MLNHPIKRGDNEVTFNINNILEKKEEKTKDFIFSNEDKIILRWYFSKEAGLKSSSFKEFLMSFYRFKEIFRKNDYLGSWNCTIVKKKLFETARIPC